MKAISNAFLKTLILFLLSLMLLGLLPGCMYYYKVATAYRVSLQDIKRCDSLDKYFILHQGKEVWHLSGIKYDASRLTGNLTELPGFRYQYKLTNPSGVNRYKHINREITLDQVHLYLWDTITPKFTRLDIVYLDPSAFRIMEVYHKAKGETAVSWAVPAVLGGAALVATIAGAVAIATKSSCPLVYIKKGDGYDFAGEIFGGSIFSSLERHDYLPLPGIEPSGGSFTLKIANGLPEIQYINLAELWVVNHPDSTTVLPDRHGNIHTIAEPVPPLDAVSSGRQDLRPLLAGKDRLDFHFDEEPSLTGDSCAFNTVFLSFAVPADAATGKLVIRAGNSMWGDYTYQEFSKLFGKKYGRWLGKQGNKPAEEKIQWKKDQRFAMMVYLETREGWQFVDYFDLIGPLGEREMVMPLDLSRALLKNSAADSRNVRIKLESGFKFWDLDYAGMDFSADLNLETECIKPASAITETGRDVRFRITGNDTSYYVQYNIGEEAVVTFPDTSGLPGMKRSVFLHASGYYTPVRDYSSQPDRKALRTFLVPGRFSRFSYDNYRDFTANKREMISYPDVP